MIDQYTYWREEKKKQKQNKIHTIYGCRDLVARARATIRMFSAFSCWLDSRNRIKILCWRSAVCTSQIKNDTTTNVVNKRVWERTWSERIQRDKCVSNSRSERERERNQNKNEWTHNTIWNVYHPIHAFLLFSKIWSSKSGYQPGELLYTILLYSM